MYSDHRYFVGIPEMFDEKVGHHKLGDEVRKAAEEKFQVLSRLASGDGISEEQVIQAQLHLKAGLEYSDNTEAVGRSYGNLGDIAGQALYSAKRIINQGGAGGSTLV